MGNIFIFKHNQCWNEAHVTKTLAHDPWQSPVMTHLSCHCHCQAVASCIVLHCPGVVMVMVMVMTGWCWVLSVVTSVHRKPLLPDTSPLSIQNTCACCILLCYMVAWCCQLKLVMSVIIICACILWTLVRWSCPMSYKVRHFSLNNTLNRKDLPARVKDILIMMVDESLRCKIRLCISDIFGSQTVHL